jgi:hypothetical protein
MHSLHRFLIDYDMAMLRALAQNRGVALTTNRQPEAADQLATALLDPLSVRTALARLSSEGRTALEALLAAGGRIRAPHFARRFGQVRPVGPGRLERETPWQNPANPAEELWYAGLIYRAFAEEQGGPGEFVFVPDDLRPLLPEPQVGPPIFGIEPVPAPRHVPMPRDPRGGGQALVHDLFLFLVYVQNHDLRLYADGRLARRDLAALHRRLSSPDERRLAFLRHLAGRLGFVVQKDGCLHLNAGPVRHWLTAAPSHQLAALQQAWRDDPTWNDLCRVPALDCDRDMPWRNDPLATRRALLALLARCPLDGWWTLDSFTAAVKEIHPDFQRPDGDYGGWYIRDAASGDYLSSFESWDRVEGALIADLLTGPLCWLGVVMAAVDAADPATANLAATACRLTEAGARFLGLLPQEPEAQPPLAVAIHSDLTVEIPPPVSLYTRFQLERFADLESEDPCCYRLTVDGLGRALGRGLEVEQVVAFLRQASDDRMPANVAGQLHLWAGRFGQVELEEVALLQVKNERVLKELSVLPETRSLIGRVLSPTSALVRKADLPRLRVELRALGFLPAEGSDDPSTTSPA